MNTFKSVDCSTSPGHKLELVVNTLNGMLQVATVLRSGDSLIGVGHYVCLSQEEAVQFVGFLQASIEEAFVTKPRVSLAKRKRKR